MHFDPLQGPQLSITVKNAKGREEKDIATLFDLLFATDKQHEAPKGSCVRSELCRQAAQILRYLYASDASKKSETATEGDQRWRAQVDLNSLSKAQLIKFLQSRGVSPPEQYDEGDLVKLAQQTQFIRPQTRQSDTQEEKIPFFVRPKQSSISGAGMGVFLETLQSGESIKAGTVLAFYPGSVYAPSDMLAVYPHIYIDNSYLITRLDETLIDANPVGMSNRVFKMSWQRERKQRLSLATSKEREQQKEELIKADLLDFPALFDNPYAVGHLVNHPPAGSQPNVLCFQLDFYSTDFPSSVQSRIPNIYFRPSSHQTKTQTKEVDPTEKETEPSLSTTNTEGQGDLIMKGMVLISTREIMDGEEILLDYHFNSKSESLPPWYTPVTMQTK